MAIAEINRTLPRPKPVHYPTGDGKPMAETEAHVLAILQCIDTLRLYFRDRNDVYIIGNNFIYYVEGDPYKRVSPDCYVVFGVEKRERPSYKVWEEDGKYPDLILEVTSKETKKKDTDFKRRLYEAWGVKEYVQFDPLGDYMKPLLQGLRLVDGEYVPIPSSDNRLHSEVLGLTFVVVGHQLRLFDPVQNAFLPTLVESVEQTAQAQQQAELEQQRAEAERHRAETLEEENRRLRAALEAALKRQNADADSPASEEGAA